MWLDGQIRHEANEHNFFSTFHCKHTKAGPTVTKFCSDKNTEELSGACIEETAYKQNFLLRTGLCSG
jgi:hypothetical protein